MIKLSVIIPAYNEEKTIAGIIKKVIGIKIKGVAKDIIIVNDCSTDNTKKILEKINNKSVKILSHKKNMGKGSSIRTGLEYARGDIILIQDADLEYSPEEYEKLLSPIINGKAEVVYGSRLNAIRKDMKNMYKLHYIGNLFLTLMTNILYHGRISDMETGYKVFKREVIENISLKANRFDFEPEITAKILKKGYRIHEVPISFAGRKFDQGKKITWIDGIKAAYYLVKYRFVD